MVSKHSLLRLTSYERETAPVSLSFQSHFQLLLSRETADIFNLNLA